MDFKEVAITMKKCQYCLCRDCKLAFSNGGAPGCGNCEECQGTPNQKPVGICNEYIHDEKAKVRGVRLDRPIIEETNISDFENLLNKIFNLNKGENENENNS